MVIKKIFFDLDGVLADFDYGVVAFAGFEILDQSSQDYAREDLMLEHIRKVNRFYYKLPPMPGAVDMFNSVYSKYGDCVEILSGIPKPRRGITGAADDKIEWAHKYLSADLKVNIVFKEEKKNYCKGKDYILIDDLDANIHAWEKCGGTGILHTSPEITLSELKIIESI